MTMPSSVSGGPSLFDKFANLVGGWVSHALFFLICVMIVVLWMPTLFLLSIDSSQLIINTLTTIITFLLVALLQNTQKRESDASQKKLNAIADGLADLLEATDGCTDQAIELRKAVGLEQKENT